MESTALLLELDVPPILVCVKLLAPDFHGGTEAKCVRAADQSHDTYTEHSADGRVLRSNRSARTKHAQNLRKSFRATPYLWACAHCTAHTSQQSTLAHTSTHS